VSGTLPSGLTYADGVISGTIANDAAGAYTVTITASDPTANGTAASVTRSFIWTVTAPPPTTGTSTSTHFSVGMTSAGLTFTIGLMASGTPPPNVSPTGIIELRDGNTVIGTATADGFGNVTIIVSNLSVGSHAITAVYLGDSNFNSSSSGGTIPTIEQGPSTVQTGSGPALALGDGLYLHVDPVNGDLIVEVGTT
ncbi:MAG: Ig-like domain repeat protein, partial [Planctomycetes bacterium]|nr:Ig-like domain repeat protein [Planctomycetota bacterium]